MSHAGSLPAALRAENVTYPHGAGRTAGMGLFVVGAIGLGVLVAAGAAGVGGLSLKHALGVYHIGTMAVLAMCLGSLFFVMAFHLINAGWSATIRRQFENVASFLPFAYLLILPTLAIEIATHGKLFLWLDPAYYADHSLQAKSAYFYLPSKIVDEAGQPLTSPVFPLFFVIRAGIYGVVWTYLSRTLAKLSRTQDETGGTEASAKARFTSSWGMLLFALTTAFAAFDWLMSLDFKFFSTMWGVYYFAGSAFSASALVAVILSRIRGGGRLQGAVTSEHFHDLGKLMFSFVVFWAYIAFSQYFLIWYSNIPEETAFFHYRSDEGSPWRSLGIFLMIGHFGAPFLILLFRGVKKSNVLLGLMGLWALLAHVLDLYWVVRPMVYAANPSPPPVTQGMWLDVVGIVGVLAVFAGYLCWKIPSVSLVPLRDPYMHEAMEHRNYV